LLETRILNLAFVKKYFKK